MDKIKTLSQAIRLGAKLGTKQCKWYLCQPAAYLLTENQEPTETCVMGAAMHAVFGAKGIEYGGFEKLYARFDVPHHVVKSAVDRNNSGKNTREEIADWLEGMGY